MSVRPLYVLAILVAAAVAGCTQEPSEPEGPAQAPQEPALTFLEPVDMVCPPQPALQDCQQFGEPQVEVQGDGTIWYSSVCCVGQSPPIWLSRDGGQTFEGHPHDGTGVAREVYGIEGDFAVDDAGNVYFFDIALVSSYFTKFAPDGQHVFTKADPLPPLVDRPWVRAGAEDEVFIAYNTGFSTWFYRSDDGGLTWDLVGGTEFPCGLGNLSQGPVRDHLMLMACDPFQVWQSHDGGITWEEPLVVAGDVRSASSGPTPPAAADDAGNVYAPLVVDVDGEALLHIASWVGGKAREPVPVTGVGLADYPWIVAGREGHVAVAFYGSDEGRLSDADDARWRLRVAYATDAHEEDATWTVVDADPEVLLEGAMGRNLGDFLQVRQAEDGDLVIAYAARSDGSLTSRFVRSDGLDMGRAVFPNGPAPTMPTP